MIQLVRKCDQTKASQASHISKREGIKKKKQLYMDILKGFLESTEE